MDHDPPEHRDVPGGRGFAWVRHALATLAANPRGLVQVAAASLLLRWLPMMVLAFQPLAAVLMLALAALGPALRAGLLFAAAEHDAGRPVGVRHLFEGLRRPGVRTQLLVLGGFALMEFVVMQLAAQRIIGPEHLHALQQLAREQIKPDSPAVKAAVVPCFKALLAMGASYLLLWCGLFFAVPRVLFDERPGLNALGDSYEACWRQVLPVCAFVLGMAAVVFALTIGLAVLATFLGLLGGLGALLFVPMVVAAMVAFEVIAAVANWLAWREIFGGAGASAPPPRAGIVV